MLEGLIIMISIISFVIIVKGLRSFGAMRENEKNIFEAELEKKRNKVELEEKKKLTNINYLPDL